MSPTLLITSPVWTAAGWTMLHLTWVGAAIGLLAGLGRSLLRPARAEARYALALACLIALGISPAVIFVRLYEGDSRSDMAVILQIDAGRTSTAASEISKAALSASPEMHGLAVEQPVSDSRRWSLDSVVAYLPWFWLAGSFSTLAMLATGLVGVEQLRRSSRLVADG